MTKIILIMLFLFPSTFFILTIFKSRYSENFKFYYIFTISGVGMFFVQFINDVNVYIVKYKTLPPSVEFKTTDFYVYFFSITSVIIGLLFEVLEGQKIIRADIRFKVGDVYFYTNDETNLFEIEKIKNVDIQLSYLKFENPSYEINGLRTREIKKISKFIKMIDDGIITKRA